MNAVTTLNAHLTTIQCPAELRTLPAWVMWRLEYHEGEDKPRKVPFYANGQRRHGKQGTPDDRQQLVTFDAARAAAARRGMDGVGIALMPEWGLAALDFDRCVLPSGDLHPEVAAIAAQSYAEWSPSGNGVRVLFRGNLLNRKSFDEAFGFETFSTKGFVTFTGNRLDACDVLGNQDTVAEVTDEVLALFARRFKPREDAEAVGHTDDVVGLTPAEIERALTALDPDAPHDEWLHVGMALHHETRGEGFDLWNDWSERGAKYPGRDVLRHRWDSFGRYDGPAVTGRTLVMLANDKGAAIGPAAPASAEEFDEIVASAPADKPPRFAFEPVHAFASAKALPWIIKGVLPQAGLAVVYGASGAGKSFAVLDMCVAVARGQEWRQRRVKQGRVAYIAAEGAEGFRKRLAAYAHHHGVDLTDVPMVVLSAAPNLMEKKDAADIVVGIEAAGGASVIVVDTFAQATPGANENAGEDVGKALGYCRLIHQRTGALVLLVHHSGKDAAKGARGWSGLRAAADAEIEVVRTDAGARYMRLSKNKDGVDGLEWGFELDVVTLGVDEDGDEITSCVVREAEVPKARQVSRKLGPIEKVVLEVFQEFAQAQTEGIERDAVIAEAVRRMPEAEGGRRDTRRQRVARAISGLCDGDDAPFWVDADGCMSVL